CSIKADRNKLWRVFNNLIKNALEAIPDKGNVNINVGGSGEEIITTIEDNGVGISESGLDQIFQPFVTTKSNGTGLGLSIVQRIVSAHKGRVFLSSKEGEGTVFRVELPKKGG
ncbi:HAMP domain-containing histidine kinase, partial [candidate division WOR-3 bacterium]|nr:HAMP domain-containing histidine kinase [candidate division WOR-3 bacterium]